VAGVRRREAGIVVPAGSAFGTVLEFWG